MSKHFFAVLVFVLAVMLQLWFAPGGMRGDFVLAVLVVFSFLFEFWELAIFILVGALILNSSLHPTIAIFMLILVPIAAYFIRRYFSLDPWLGAAVAIALGIVLFYAATAPIVAFYAVGYLLIDILACVIFGELVLCGMEG